MAKVELIMPKMGESIMEATILKWVKQVGDKVEEGDILAEIETDKATMEFESFQSGNLLYIGLKEGESAKVDDLLAIIGPNGADISAALNPASAPAAATTVASAPVAANEAVVTPVATPAPKTPVATENTSGSAPCLPPRLFSALSLCSRSIATLHPVMPAAYLQ